MSVLRVIQFLLYIVLLPPLLACAQTATRIQADYVFEHVNVIPMNRETVLEDRRVAVMNRRIVAILEQESPIKVVSNSVIDGKGHYLMPGLADMHVHLRLDPQTMFDLWLANGVTTVTNMGIADGGGSVDHIQLGEDIAKGKIQAPRYLVSGPQLTPQDVPDVQHAQSVLNEHVRRGYDVIKIHQNLDKAAYDALLKGAATRDLRVTGHLQHWMPLEASLRMSSIEHIEEFLYTKIEGFAEPKDSAFLDWAAYYEHCENMQNAIYRKPVVELVKASEIYLDPTLVIYQSLVDWVDDERFANLHKDLNLVYLPVSVRDEYLNSATNEYRQPGFPFTSTHLKQNLETLKALLLDFHYAGVPMLLGTDAFGTLVPGFSLHQEMALIASAGISPYDVLRMGTVNVASYLGESDSAGTIEVGKRADFILLKQNPLDDIQNARQVEGVFTQGHWYSARALKDLLLDAKSRSAAAK